MKSAFCRLVEGSGRNQTGSPELSEISAPVWPIIGLLMVYGPVKIFPVAVPGRCAVTLTRMGRSLGAETKLHTPGPEVISSGAGGLPDGGAGSVAHKRGPGGELASAGTTQHAKASPAASAQVPGARLIRLALRAHGFPSAIVSPSRCVTFLSRPGRSVSKIKAGRPVLPVTLSAGVSRRLLETPSGGPFTQSPGGIRGHADPTVHQTGAEQARTSRSA
ncbi:hypothetical protein Sliba_15490 [Streptomyces nigrescens]|uniref:Uncharacterized protein n=1 Tax=Streptomyces nigrescens TaxID=1920 RepID=A0A640TFT3_STRNI|nr:hypothetical protein Sliba_15490 [Streptomyces libani subsp. libani]GGV88950.1 hypothetical protein GCM10010500_12900 [Streptomyces libani subsp. libani]